MTSTSVVPRMSGSRAFLALIFTVSLTIALNGVMLSVALPRVVLDLGASSLQGNWMILAFSWVQAGLLVLGGQLSDTFNQRRLFLIGVGVFVVASLGLALTPTAGVFIALRAVQAVGSALVFGVSGAMIAGVFPGVLLSGAMGIYLGGYATGDVLGPSLGGVITAVLGWRMLFVLSALLGLTVIIWSWRLLTELPQRVRRPGRRLDPIGNILIFIGLGALLFALSRVQRHGWLDPEVLLAFAGFGACVAVFPFVERRVANPAIDLRLFRTATVALAAFAGSILLIPRSSTAVLLSLYFQGFHDNGPFEAALKITPLAVAVVIGSFSVRYIARRGNERTTAMWFAMLAAVGVVVLMMSIRGEGMLAGIIVGIVLIGLSTGVTQPTIAGAIIAAAPPERVGNVNGTRLTFFSSTSAVGLALSLSIIVGGLTSTQAQAFFSGQTQELTAESLNQLSVGYQVAFAVILALVVLAIGAAAMLVRQARRHPRTSGDVR